MGALDKFVALAEALDIADDTEALERPEPGRTTVRGALQAGRRRPTNGSARPAATTRPMAA